MERLFNYLFLIVATLGSLQLRAQLPADLTFDTQQKYVSGHNVTIVDQWSNFTTVSLGGNLTVKAAGDLINGGNSIPIGNITAQVTAIRSNGININLGSSNTVVPLSTTATTCFSGLSIGVLSTTYYTFKYQTAGGAAFINKPAGVYSTTLTFAIGGSILATATLSVTINNIGTITGSNSTLTFNTMAAYKTGIQSTQANLLNTIFSNQPYKIMVKAQSANITNGVNTIPVNNILAAIEPATAVALSTSNQLLAPSTGTIAPTIAIQQHSVKFITSALNSVFINKPPGNYTITLLFSMMDLSDNPYPTAAPATATVTLTINIANTIALTLENGADNAELSFSNINNYLAGTSLIQNNAINIFSNNPYVVSVKTSTAQLTYLSNNIPVSNVYLLTTPSTIMPSIITSPITLSNLSKTIVDASTSGLGTFSQYFNLKYYTQPLDNIFINKPAGTYTTVLTYTVTQP